ncbi:DUF116 domain-containing protein [bacterium]|nr:MAG: DUF116 domain-containing protein [bacterium]
MMDGVTYSLQCGEANSETYYRQVRRFTDEVLEQAQSTVMPTVADFLEYIRTYHLEDVRQSEEYVLELLSFGLLWNSYGGYALATRRAPFVTMARMAEWRKRHQRWKPAIDLARGILTTLFLLPRRGDKRPAALPVLRDVDRFCRWLEATGEFREQALRLVRWRAFWETMPAKQRAEMAGTIFRFTGWFIARSEEVLGQYTPNVNRFLEASRKRYRWREDRIQCKRSRAEYHLNMVGAEIMNRAFRPDYTNTEAKALLLPGCMRGRPEGECEAEHVPEGLRCTGCLPSCHVNQLREMGKKQNFEVYIIPHASDLRRWSPRPGRPRLGVVATACVTQLVEGGWELKRYDVPAQCVLLDYSGCKKHWHPDGVPTALNMRELKRILDGRLAAQSKD